MREAEWCCGSNIWHESAWISTFALIRARMWPWASLGSIFLTSIIVTISYTLTGRMVRANRVTCTLWPGTQRALKNVAPASGALACSGTYMLDEVT